MIKNGFIEINGDRILLPKCTPDEYKQYIELADEIKNRVKEMVNGSWVMARNSVINERYRDDNEKGVARRVLSQIGPYRKYRNGLKDENLKKLAEAGLELFLGNINKEEFDRIVEKMSSKTKAEISNLDIELGLPK